MSVWVLENESDSEHRPGHIECLRQFRNWLRNGAPGGVFSIYMCCRYGKSDTIRNLSLTAIAESKAGCALVIHPSVPLSQQFLEQNRVKAWRQRWLPSGPRLAKVATLQDFAHESLCNGEWIGSIHIHALMQPMQKALLVQWVEKCQHDHGKKPVVFFDEAHQFSASNKWGDLARELQALGCLIVVLTATPFRNDQDDVFGFRKEEIAKNDGVKINYVMPSLDPDKLELHTVTQNETEYLIRADVEVPFSQGWAEKTIAKCTFDLIDWHMDGWGEGREGDKRMLSEIPKKEARSVLPSLYRDNAAIKEAARRALSHLSNFRQGTVKDATIVWYGMNDESSRGVDSENQKLIRQALLDEDPSLKVAIATMGEDKTADEKSSETILKFVDERKKHYDALVLKQMGSAGLDSDRICVVVLWNSVRSLNQMIQMAMRGGNSRMKSHFVIIGLADSTTKEKLEAFVEGEGGKYIEKEETDHEVSLVDRTETPKGGYVPVRVAENGMSDSDGKVASFDDVQIALSVIAIWPSVIVEQTIPQIAEQARKLGLTAKQVTVVDSIEDTAKLVQKLGDNLNEHVKRIGRLLFIRQNGRSSNGSKEDLEQYGILYHKVKKEIKRRAGVNKPWDKKNKKRSQTVSDYQKWTAAADAIYQELCDAENS